MAKRRRSQRFDLDSLILDRTGQEPLYSQVQHQLRQAILEGRLSPGERVPSTRRLAGLLDVGRITVANAYDQLISEGYLVATVGSGTRVSPTLPEHLLQASRPKQNVPRDIGVSELSPRGRQIAKVAVQVGHDNGSPKPFRPHIPALDVFPRDIWEKITMRRQKRVSRDLFARVDSVGYGPLREAVAGYLGASRGVRCTPHEIIITAGAQQGIDLVSRLLIAPGDAVWMEEPGYLVACPAFEMCGATVTSVPLDAQGVDVVAGTRLCPHPRLVYVTPSCQWPTGITMSLNRRIELLCWAERSRTWILEDDYAGEFRYGGHPLPALQGLDRSGRVIYMGTFSKVLFPSLRLGYLVVPPGLVDAFGAARWLADRHSPLLEQAVLADFIEDGHFARHIRQMRTLYAERQAAVVDCIQKEMAGALAVDAAETGMHLIAQATGRPETTVMDAATDANVAYHPISWFSRSSVARGLILGYAAYTPEASRKAIQNWAWKLDHPKQGTGSFNKK